MIITMKYEIDLKSFCDALRESEESDFAGRLCDTPGERYLYDNVLQKFVSGVPVRICDIDFDAFDEDDIVELIDNKNDNIYKFLCGVSLIVENFCKSNALTAKTRKFF